MVSCEFVGGTSRLLFMLYMEMLLLFGNTPTNRPWHQHGTYLVNLEKVCLHVGERPHGNNHSNISHALFLLFAEEGAWFQHQYMCGDDLRRLRGCFLPLTSSLHNRLIFITWKLHKFKSSSCLLLGEVTEYKVALPPPSWISGPEYTKPAHTNTKRDNLFS